LETGYKVFENQLISIYPELLYTYSSATTALNVGAVTSYSLDYVNPRAAGSTLEFHTKYLLHQGAMIGIQFVNEGFSAGMSYDVPINNNSAHRGAFEIGLELRKLIESRYKSSRRRVKKIRKRRIKKVRKSTLKRKNKNTNKNKSNVKELLSDNDLDKSETAIEIEAEEIDVKDENNTTRDLQEKKDDFAIDQEESKDMKVNTRIGNLKHESLLLEPTQLIYYFDFDSSDSEKEAKEYISDLISVLKEDKYVKIKIVGHTDNVGTDAYNLILSRKRAKVIVDQLTENNISTSRIISDGKGESEPISDNSNAEQRSKNRRVEITLYY
jgi:outer membrane protein OmpA-like peptidoglycan-associated protein